MLLLKEFTVSDLRSKAPVQAAQREPVLIRHLRTGDMVLMSKAEYLKLMKRKG